MNKEKTTKGEVTRLAIEEAALELFMEQGYHATSMRQIADKAGLALGGIYNHFSSKDEIFEAVDRFYRAYYLRPKPILRIIKTMLEDKDVCVRRLREGYEFFKSMAQRRTDLEAAKAAG